MKKLRRGRDFLLGMLVMAFLMSMITPAGAALTKKTITVRSGVNFYVDDRKIEPTDVNGNPVEVYNINGTVYLPVRALSKALGKPIQYDGKTYSVYVGSHSSAEPFAYLSDMDYFSGTNGYDFETSTSEQDNTGATHYHCITTDFTRTYLLNGDYSAITGTIYQTYARRSYKLYGEKNNYLEIYGDGKLLYTKSFDSGSTGIKPVDFNVDLTGVLEMKVVFCTRGYNQTYDVLSLGDVALWT